MEEDQLLSRPCKLPPAGTSEGEYQRADDIAFIKAQLAQLRREMGLFFIILGGAALAILWGGLFR